MYAFDQDTAVTAIAPQRYRGTVTDRWDIGTVPNGGYVLAIAMSAFRQALSAPDPLTVTAHYLKPCAHGPLDVLVDVAKRGKRHVTSSARIVQDDVERLRVIATYGDLGDASGFSYVDGAAPELPADARGEMERSGSSGEHRIGGPRITERFKIRFAHGSAGFFTGAPSGKAEICGAIRFADGREPDVHALALFADAFPPPLFNIVMPGWVPTVELTVHVRARPKPGWLRCRFRTRFVFGGYLEEDGEVWDEKGTLVALSRQLAVMPR